MQLVLDVGKVDRLPGSGALCGIGTVDGTAGDVLKLAARAGGDSAGRSIFRVPGGEEAGEALRGDGWWPPGFPASSSR